MMQQVHSVLVLLVVSLWTFQTHWISTFPVFPVEVCPDNATEVEKVSEKLNCTFGFNENRNEYHCVPLVDFTQLVEFCYPKISGLIENGLCMVLYEDTLDARTCHQFQNGCPDEHYTSETMYQFPACSKINKESKCYLADPSCPPLWQLSSTTSPNTTVKNINRFNTTTNGNITTNTATTTHIIIGIFIPLSLLVLLVLVYFIFKRKRGQRRDDKNETGDKDNMQLLQVLGPMRNGSERNEEPTAENGRDTMSSEMLPDNKQNHNIGEDGPNALLKACGNAKLELSKHLIQIYPSLLPSVDNDGWNAALHAARGGNVQILKLLADNEVNVKHKNNNGWNILHVACLNSNLEMCRYIIQTYPELLHSVDNDGKNAALYSARGGKVEVLQLLADNGVDVKHKNSNGWNILNVACLNSNLEMSNFIIQTYPDLLIVDDDGWNDAIHAARGGNIEILQLLAENKVDVKHKNKDGWNILNVACLNSNFEMSRYIIQTYRDLLYNVDNDGCNAALHAARGGNVKIMQLLADNKVDVRHTNKGGWNILHMACELCNVEMCRYIIQTYPDLLHSVDSDGWNAALHTARGGKVKILQLLADNGVDVKLQDNNGRNILHVACRYSNSTLSSYIIQTYSDLQYTV